MKVMAFLQNQWFKDPEAARRTFDRFPDKRHQIIRMTLFAGCLTGRRLAEAFGKQLCHRIIWEEASTVISGRASATPPAEPRHIAEQIESVRPDIVLAFGKIATGGVMASMRLIRKARFELISGPHPAARHATVRRDLQAMAGTLRQKIELGESHGAS